MFGKRNEITIWALDIGMPEFVDKPQMSKWLMKVTNSVGVSMDYPYARVMYTDENERDFAFDTAFERYKCVVKCPVTMRMDEKKANEGRLRVKQVDING